MFSSSADAESRRKADQLVAALVGMGLPSKVEPRATFAVLRVSSTVMARLAEPEIRRAVLAQARELGFTHVAVELAEDVDGGDATLRRD